MSEITTVSSAQELQALLQADAEDVEKLNVRYSLSQDELAALGRRHGASLTDLSVEVEYEDHPPELRITQGVSALFPSLSSVSFNCVNVAELDLKMPELQSLRLENARGVQRFRLDCPQLERMTFEFVEIQNARDFGPSVGRSPKLEALHAYKLWGLGVDNMRRCHTLVMPSCEDLDLYRSDDIDFIRIYAPNLSSLNLQACYGLEYVQILDEPPPGFEHLRPQLEQPKNFRVNLINASRRFRGNLMSHPRNVSPHAFLKGDPMDWLCCEGGKFDPVSGWVPNPNYGLYDDDSDEEGFPMGGMGMGMGMMGMEMEMGGLPPELANMMMQMMAMGGGAGPGEWGSADNSEEEEEEEDEDEEEGSEWETDDGISSEHEGYGEHERPTAAAMGVTITELTGSEEEEEQDTGGATYQPQGCPVPGRRVVKVKRRSMQPSGGDS